MPQRRKAGAPSDSVVKKSASSRPVGTKKSARPAAKSAPTRRGPRRLTVEHKAQLARGREETRIVRAYLEAVDTGPQRPGRRRTPESIAKQIAEVDARLRDARGIDKLNLVKLRSELEAVRVELAPRSDIGALERDFVRVARRYGERRGIDYSIWREVGVPAAVLARAKVPRTRSRLGRTSG